MPSLTPKIKIFVDTVYHLTQTTRGRPDIYPLGYTRSTITWYTSFRCFRTNKGVSSALFSFLVDHIVWIVSFLQTTLATWSLPLEQILFIFKNLAKNNWRFCVTRVTWLIVKIVTTISIFAVKIGDNLNLINSNSNI